MAVIRFVYERGIISRIIGWDTNSLWCHVEFGTGAGTWIGAHAGTGIQERPADWCKPLRERRYTINVPDEDAWEVSLRADAGKPYNYADIAGLFLHDRRFQSDGRYICSQWCIDKWMAAVKPKDWPLNCLPGYVYLITPETLHLSGKLIDRCIYASS